MRLMALLFVVAWSVVSFAGEGGVGGFVGGSRVQESRFGALLFQDYSLHVNPILNNTVCLNRNDEYQAKVGPFYQQNDSGRMVKTEEYMAFQPRVSMREDCTNWIERRDRPRTCRAQNRIWVPFVQPRHREQIPVWGEQRVEYYQDFTVPRCR